MNPEVKRKLSTIPADRPSDDDVAALGTPPWGRTIIGIPAASFLPASTPIFVLVAVLVSP